MGIKYIVQGALCKCRYGSVTDKVKVKSHNKIYFNDLDCNEKLAVTNKDLGTTFEKNSFGSCSKRKNNPCNVTVLKWSNEEPQIIENAGNLLTEKSKATCPIGGNDCISVIFHGQTAQVSQQNLDNVNEETHSQINPFVDLKEVGNGEINRATLIAE